MEKQLQSLKKIRLILLLLCAGTGLNLFAQDIHFSQFYTAPLQLNPASAGFFNGKYRVGLNSKSQWNSVTKPYQTLSAGVDAPVYRRKIFRDAFGAGLLIGSDIAGDSKFSTTEVSLMMSYIKSLNFKNSHFISVGISPAFAQRSVNYNDLYFDNQFNGARYDPSLGNGENFSTTHYGFFDLSAGAYWFYAFDQYRNIDAGFSMSHLNRPRVSFMGNDNIRMDIRYTFHARSLQRLSQSVDALPALLFMRQGPYTEVMFGSLFKYVRNRQMLSYTSVNVGIFVRTRDAMAIVAGFDYNRFAFGISYDVNLSTLKPASLARGGFEISLSYFHNRQKMRKAKDIPCPIF